MSLKRLAGLIGMFIEIISRIIVKFIDSGTMSGLIHLERAGKMCGRTCGVRTWEKAKGKGYVGFEAGTCCTARDVSEKYQSQTNRSLEH